MAMDMHVLNHNEDTVLIYENGIFIEEKKRTDLPVIQRTISVEKKTASGEVKFEIVPTGKIESIYIGSDGNRTTYEKARRIHVTVYSQDGESELRLIIEKEPE